MLIFGGITSRTRFLNKTDKLMYDVCEFYDEKYGTDEEN